MGQRVAGNSNRNVYSGDLWHAVADVTLSIVVYVPRYKCAVNQVRTFIAGEFRPVKGRLFATGFRTAVTELSFDLVVYSGD